MRLIRNQFIDSVEVLKLQVARLENCNSDLRATNSELLDTSRNVYGGLNLALKPIIGELRSLRKSLVWTLCGMFLVSLGTLSAILIFVIVGQTGINLSSEKTKDGWHHELGVDQKK